MRHDLVVLGVAPDDPYAAACRRFSEQQTETLLILNLRVQNLNRAFGGRNQLQELLSAVERADHQRQVSGIKLVAVPVGVKEAVQLAGDFFVLDRHSEVSRVMQIVLGWIESQDQ